jgi:hemolysin activation/secretion protein
MNKNLKYILVIAVIIIIVVVLMSFTAATDSKENSVKKSEVDGLFATWMNIAGAGDKLTLSQNEASIKKDLFDKLNSQEITSLKNYSTALQDMLNSKGTPWSATFLNSLAYLTTNFNSTKQIVGKTNASNIFANFGFSGLPKIK